MSGDKSACLCEKFEGRGGGGEVQSCLWYPQPSLLDLQLPADLTAVDDIASPPCQQITRLDFSSAVSTTKRPSYSLIQTVSFLLQCLLMLLQRPRLLHGLPQLPCWLRPLTCATVLRGLARRSHLNHILLHPVIVPTVLSLNATPLGFLHESLHRPRLTIPSFLAILVDSRAATSPTTRSSTHTESSTLHTYTCEWVGTSDHTETRWSPLHLRALSNATTVSPPLPSYLSPFRLVLEEPQRPEYS
jgi:hypothetical protein